MGPVSKGGDLKTKKSHLLEKCPLIFLHRARDLYGPLLWLDHN